MVRCEAPNAALESWHGIVNYNNDEYCVVNTKSLILRGSVLKNSAYCIGLVIYVGADTKCNQNIESSKYKESWLVQLMHRTLNFLFIF